MKKKVWCCLSVVALFLLCAPLERSYPDSGGYVWRASTGGRIRGRPVATRSGTIYVLSEDRHLYSLDEYTGGVEWKAYLGGRVWDSLCIGADGTIYTVLKDGDLVAANSGGGIAWKFNSSGLPVGNPAAVNDGTVYFVLDTGVLLAVSHTGRERWRVKLQAPPATGPAVGTNGDVYVGTIDRRVFAFHPWGEESWNALLAGVPVDPAITAEGMIIYGTDFGSIVALDPAGDILWDLVADERFLSPVSSAGRILAATGGGEVIALDLKGNLLWRKPLSENLTGSLSVTAGNDLIALSKQGFLLRIRDDGQLTEKFDVRGSGELFSVTPSGKYVFGREDWLVYAYQGSLPASTGWPQPGGDPQHTSNSMPRVESDAWLEAFREDVDYLYLYHLNRNGASELKERALSEIEMTIRSGGAIPPYCRLFLEDLASEGTLRASMQYGVVVNDFPAIRGKAARLLGEIGTLQSADLLVQLLTYEYDPGVQRQFISAIGALKTDRNGLATAAISGVALGDLRGRGTPDPRLAGAALVALESIYRYQGRMPNEAGNELLFEIFRGAYPKETREAALKLIRQLTR